MTRPYPDFNVSTELQSHGLEHSPGQVPGVYVESAVPHFYEDWDMAELANFQLGNPDLPTHAFEDQIVSSVAHNPITIIVAETGAGKSTQVPLYLLKAGYRAVYLTQPRRAAARNVFLRIRDEITEARGKFAGEDLVNYQTAGERDGPEDATIRIVTDGLHLVRELHDKGIEEHDVLIIDEAHEWNSNVEVLVAWTKRALIENPRLRVVVMSATMDAEHLAEYYSEVCQTQPSVIEIPGRTFMVEKSEKPESTVVDEVVGIVTSLTEGGKELSDGPNGILVFEPGKREIQEAIDEIRQRLPIEAQAKVKMFPLHAKLSALQQQEALTQYPDCIKIVVATEVAQTSLTIPDIRYVVDSGYQRRIEVDDEGTRGLKLNAISRADCAQRAGRTGRVSDGSYVLTKLNADTPHVLLEDRDEYPMPEILRTDIARNTLRLKALGIEIEDFDMYHKASRHILKLANVNLVLLGALDAGGELTPTGYKMDQYPLCTSSARIMVESMRYNESIRAYLAAIVAAKEIGGLQYFAFNVGKQWKELTNEDSSDLLVQLDLFIASQEMSISERKDYDLDINNVERTQELYAKVAALAGTEVGLLKPPTEAEREDILRCLYTGFLPSIYAHQGGGMYAHASNGELTKPRELSNRSLVAGTPDFVVGDPYRVELFSGAEATQRHFIENVSAISAQALGSVAASRVVWKPEGYVMRDGKFLQQERQMLFGIDLGLVHEVSAAPTPRLRNEIIAHALENPGAEQKKLRLIKKELEGLAHRAKDPVRHLTHDRIIDLVYQSAPDDITSPATIEDNLRVMLSDPESGLTLNDFVSAERREEIIRNSPATIEVEGVTLRVTYRKGTAVTNISDLDVITRLQTNEVCLEDGRPVLFVVSGKDGHRKKFTLSELKYRLGN